MNLLGRLALRELRREFRRRELRTVALAMTVAVIMVTLVLLLTDSLQLALERVSGRFIASERQLVSDTPVAPVWLAEAQKIGLRTAVTAEFNSMLFAGERMQLVSTKAVDQNYPLLGMLKTSHTSHGPLQQTHSGPAVGEVWVSPRLQSLLAIIPGDIVELGDIRLRATRILRWEPDISMGLSAFAPRMLMNLQDLAAAHLGGPGSRIKWRLLLARKSTAQPLEVLQKMHAWLKPRLNPQQQWLSANNRQRGLSRSLVKAQSYLRLTGTLVLILAALAISLSARQYAEKQLVIVALKKTLGIRGRQIIQTELIKLSILALLTTLTGTALGFGLWYSSVQWASTFLQLSSGDLLQHLRLPGILPAVGIAWLMAYSIVLPQLWRLRNLSPVTLFQTDPQLTGHALIPLLLGSGMLVIFCLGFNRDLSLTLILSGGLLAMVLTGVLIIRLLLRLVNIRGTGVSSAWSMGLAGLRRRSWQNAFHILFLATAMTLLASAWSLESGLIDRWQNRLPADAPNNFLVNIDPADQAAIIRQLGGRIIQDNFYPVVRGRLTQVNGQPASQRSQRPLEALNRSLNLTWSDKLPKDNQLIAGHWWSKNSNQSQNMVSIAAHLAGELNIRLGDQISFAIADQQLTATVQSIRQVEWQNLRPNFYFIFPKGALDGFPQRWMAGLYLSPEHQSDLDQLIRRYPSISLISVTEVITRLRTIFASISTMIERLLYLLLIAGLLMILVLINASRSERVHESVLIRALGGHRRLLVWGQIVEFGLMGLVSGLLAAPASIFLGQLLTGHWLGGEVVSTAVLWLVLPVLGSVLNALLGYWQIRDIADQPPMRLLSSSKTA